MVFMTVEVFYTQRLSSSSGESDYPEDGDRKLFRTSVTIYSPTRRLVARTSNQRKPPCYMGNIWR